MSVNISFFTSQHLMVFKACSCSAYHHTWDQPHTKYVSLLASFFSVHTASTGVNTVLNGCWQRRCIELNTEVGLGCWTGRGLVFSRGPQGVLSRPKASTTLPVIESCSNRTEFNHSLLCAFVLLWVYLMLYSSHAAPWLITTLMCLLCCAAPSAVKPPPRTSLLLHVCLHPSTCQLCVSSWSQY